MCSFNVKDNNICPCQYNIRLSYNISESTCLQQTVNRKYLPKRESTHANVQSCPFNEKKGIGGLSNKLVFLSSGLNSET